MRRRAWRRIDMWNGSGWTCRSCTSSTRRWETEMGGVRFIESRLIYSQCPDGRMGQGGDGGRGEGGWKKEGSLVKHPTSPSCFTASISIPRENRHFFSVSLSLSAAIHHPWVPSVCARYTRAPCAHPTHLGVSYARRWKLTGIPFMYQK